MKKSYQELLEEIRILNNNYLSSVEGRKDIINSIRKNIVEIRKKTDVCNEELNKLEMHYSYLDYYISDYKMVMNLILRLANSEEELYSMKEITTTDFFELGKETKQLYSEVFFITNKDIMEKFADHLYYYDSFAHLATELINENHSMIIVTKNLFEANVKPKHNQIQCENIFDIRNGGLTGNISCYINNHDLMESMNKLINYIKINGPDFNGIDEDTLFNLMNDTSNYQKKIN